MKIPLAFAAALFAACTAVAAGASAPRRGFNLVDMLSVDWCRDGRFKEEDFEIIAGWGFDFARLPIDCRFIAQGCDSRRTGFGRIDEAVAFGRKHKVHVQLCLHRIPGYTSGVPAETRDIFSDAGALAEACALWREIAARYKDVPRDDLSFNLMNEPPYIDEAKYAKVALALLGAIREADARRLVVADGLGYGRIAPNTLREANLGYSWHCYDPFFVTHYMTPWNKSESVAETPRWPVDARSPLKWLFEETFATKGWDKAIEAGVPVHVGEFGVWRKTSHDVTLSLMEDQLKFWKERKIGWALWNLRGDFGVLDSNRPDVEYEDFRGHKLDRKMLELLQRY